MTRFGRALLTFLMVAFTATPILADEMSCATTGFNLNIGTTTKSFRCGLVVLQRGLGTITLNGTSTATSSGAFGVIVTPQTAPAGADDNFFKTSGLRIVLSGRVYFLQVSAKASNSSITVLAGGANPALTGSVTEWSYWNTQCYRSSLGYTEHTQTDVFTSGALWTSPPKLRTKALTRLNDGNVDGICYNTGNPGQFPSDGLVMRPSGHKAPQAQSPQNWTNGSCTTGALQTKYGAPSEMSTRGQEFMFTTQSASADTWPVHCFLVWE